MAVKKTARKSGKRGRADKAAPPKVELPAFGLAEEILGSTGAAGAEGGRGRTEELQSAIRNPQSEIDPAEARTPQPAVDAGPEHHLVTFNLDHEEYGVNIGSVQEIIRVGQITAVPNAPEFVKGVINLRGRVIPVLNLRRRLELSEGKLTKNSRIVVVESGAKVLGLLVDGAYGLLPYAPVFLLALAGLPILLRRFGRERWALVLTGLGVILPVLGWRNWWGFSPPARFTIPLVPILALAVAARLSAAPARGLARWRLGLVAAGLGLALLMFAEPRAMRMVTGRDGPPQVLELLAGEASPSRYLPFLSSRAGSDAPPWEPPASEARVAATWVAALGVLLLLDHLARSRDRADRWFRGLALPVGLFLVVSVAVDRWARPEGPPRVRPSVPATAS